MFSVPPSRNAGASKLLERTVTMLARLGLRGITNVYLRRYIFLNYVSLPGLKIIDGDGAYYLEINPLDLACHLQR